MVRSPRNQRMGDVAAGGDGDQDADGGRDRRRPRIGIASLGQVAGAGAWDTTGIGEDELAAARRFLERRHAVDPQARARLASELSTRLRPKVPGAQEVRSPEQFVELLVAVRRAVARFTPILSARPPALLAVVAVLAVGGCGEDQLSNGEYEEEATAALEPVSSSDLGRAAAEASTPRDVAAATDDVAKAYEDAISDLEAMEPPAAVVEAHDQLVMGLQEFADALAAVGKAAREARPRGDRQGRRRAAGLAARSAEPDQRGPATALRGGHRPGPDPPRRLRPAAGEARAHGLRGAGGSGRAGGRPAGRLRVALLPAGLAPRAVGREPGRRRAAPGDRVPRGLVLVAGARPRERRWGSARPTATSIRCVSGTARGWKTSPSIPSAGRRASARRSSDAAKEWARERGATHLELDSGDARTDAHRFYERERPSWTSRQFSWEL